MQASSSAGDAETHETRDCIAAASRHVNELAMFRAWSRVDDGTNTVGIALGIARCLEGMGRHETSSMQRQKRAACSIEHASVTTLDIVRAWPIGRRQHAIDHLAQFSHRCQDCSLLLQHAKLLFRADRKAEAAEVCPEYPEHPDHPVRTARSARARAPA